MMTPPLSMSASPRLTRVVPVCEVRTSVFSVMGSIQAGQVVHHKIHITRVAVDHFWGVH